jgi:phenylpyruvate tautomerase PptA (4-oxalocrotonate tautomerase family)
VTTAWIADDYALPANKPKEPSMPMIDVYAPDSLFPVHAAHILSSELIDAVLRAKGVASPGPFHLNNTAVFLHRMPRAMEETAGDEHAWKVRVQILTPPGALTRAGQIQVVKEVTEIVARVCGDSSQSKRTWVLLTEAAEGGWGIAGTAYGKEEFAALGREPLGSQKK